MAKDKMEQRPEPEKKCNCGPECDCGCNEGKECTCNHPHHGPHGECCCGRRCGGKLLLLLLVFLAGMGFNELWHGCFGRCPGKAPHAAAMMHMPKHQGGMPMFADGAGTVIIINAADGYADVPHYGKHKKCNKHKGSDDTDKHHGKPHHEMNKNIPQNDAGIHKPPFGGRAAPMYKPQGQPEQKPVEK